jgi:hypothetical protein
MKPTPPFSVGALELIRGATKRAQEENSPTTDVEHFRAELEEAS